MSIELYPHNQDAYDAALSMMRETGKAAVIHPTGTGKSFIGFKLAERNPEKIILWLSPSEYIYKTQLENLSAAACVYEPANISFMTYAKLMITDAEYIEGMRPDYIVLDEFHRCGAAEWGKGVKRLLDTHPKVPLLGLSATNIRYLDNQRDMADEIFDGNVASEITLGEAIAANIILPPTYITSVYSYQKDLEKYQRKVRSAKNAAVRDAAQIYLDALRRALSQAKGLGVIFEKHIKDKHGKFIIFCTNVGHMEEMKARIPEWFGRIDSEPHVYTVYAEEPSSAKEFDAFKNDSSNHLKLLFCIDMLNEGVHVEDVSGVIMFRPTVSPTIYKQQVGRALSASKCKHPVIFDIVNNFENLYSISAIVEEMREAAERYRERGEGEKIVNAPFQVIDEVRDCKRLFDALNDTLTASWDAYYETAKAFFSEHGHLDVPATYRSQKLALGKWIYTQRRVRKGETSGILSDTRIGKLDSIGMIWEQRRDMRWTAGISHAKEYSETYGNLLVPVGYVSPDGYKLGAWITYLRYLNGNKERRGQLAEGRMRQLDELGMVWNAYEEKWEKGYSEARQYFIAHNSMKISPLTKTDSGFPLGQWLRTQKLAYIGYKGRKPLAKDKAERLESIGVTWDAGR